MNEPSNRLLIMERIGGKSYYKPAEIAAKYGKSKSTIRTWMREIEQESGSGKRYPRISILRDDPNVYINEFVLLDWLSVRKMWHNPSSRKALEPFDPIQWAAMCGWHLKVVTPEEAIEMSAKEREKPEALNELRIEEITAAVIKKIGAIFTSKETTA